MCRRESLPEAQSSAPGKAGLLPAAGGRRGSIPTGTWAHARGGLESSRHQLLKEKTSVEREDALPAPSPVTVLEWFFLSSSSSWRRDPSAAEGPLRAPKGASPSGMGLVGARGLPGLSCSAHGSRSLTRDKAPHGTIITHLTFLELAANLFLLTRAILFHKL